MRQGRSFVLQCHGPTPSSCSRAKHPRQTQITKYLSYSIGSLTLDGRGVFVCHNVYPPITQPGPLSLGCSSTRIAMPYIKSYGLTDDIMFPALSIYLLYGSHMYLKHRLYMVLDLDFLIFIFIFRSMFALEPFSIFDNTHIFFLSLTYFSQQRMLTKRKIWMSEWNSICTRTSFLAERDHFYSIIRWNYKHPRS